MFGIYIEQAGDHWWLWSKEAGPDDVYKLRKSWPQNLDPMKRFYVGGQFGLRIVEGWNGQSRAYLVEQVRYYAHRLRREREKPRLHRVLKYWDA